MTEPPWMKPRSAYIHIPFCAHHCGYCDFAVTAGQDHLIDLYLEALEIEMSVPGDERSGGFQPPTGSHGNAKVENLFLGGGTPAHLSVRQLERLFSAIARRFQWDSTAEKAIEANPDSFDAEKAKRLAAFGVNRVSIGVQSFQPHLLKVLEHRHDPAHIAPAVEAGLEHIGPVSVDLIFAIPGQTLEEWDSDLQSAIALGPEQISTYGLTFEKGTRLWKQRRDRKVCELDEELQYRMYTRAMDGLEAAGYYQYEISS